MSRKRTNLIILSVFAVLLLGLIGIIVAAGGPDKPTPPLPPPAITEYDDTTPTTVDIPEVDVPEKRTGRSGHPCLPGERDGDNDGFCGEGRR